MELLEYLMMTNSCFLALGVYFQLIVKPYPLMLSFGYLIWLVYYVYTNYYSTTEWRPMGKITNINFSNEEKKMRHFVVYILNENEVNKVFQHIYASMSDQLLDDLVINELIEAVNPDNSTIEIYSCGLLIEYPFWFMEKVYNPEDNKILWIGILKHDWENQNVAERHIQKKPYMLLHVEELMTTRFKSREIPNHVYILGQFNYWNIDLKIKNKIYHDVSFCVSVYDEITRGSCPIIWRFGISTYQRSLLDGTIDNGDHVYMKYKERRISLFT